MEGSAAVPAFVNWEEVSSTNRRGRKEARFYLKRRCGTYVLAVVGKEKKLGHHTNKSSSSSYRYRYANRDKLPFLSLNLRLELPSKLRSRRAVIDCLNSIVVSDDRYRPPPQPDDVSVRPEKRHRTSVDSDYTLGSEIEVLSQDSGIRGVWFKAVVIKKHKDKLKVRYQDIKDAADESTNLEEWILSSRVAVADEMGIRHGGRMTVRPTRLANKIDVLLTDVGCIVDAWLYDGWWEGIVVRKEPDDRIHVYFPGGKNRSVFGCKDLRYSQEWLGDGWRKIEDRPDILGLISCRTETNSETTKSDNNVSGLSSEENRDIGVDLLANLNWNWSTKKRHFRSSCRSNDLVTVKTRKRESLPLIVSVKAGCKFKCGQVDPPLTSLVMSR